MTKYFSIVSALVVLSTCSVGRAGEIPKEYRPVINKGLKWLADNQARDGHWQATGAQHPVAMTSLAGMAFLMEGSTIREGKYSQQIRRAADWVMRQAVNTGQIGNPQIPGQFARYMYDHGFAVLFRSPI